jgi:type III restriction enzyme
MALHPEFPTSPYVVLEPQLRWFPADESLRDVTMDRLMPPLVAQIRKKVKEFRDGGYIGASDTSRALLKWWFETPHLIEQADGESVEFRYYFAQRESLETLVYLYEVAGVKDHYDLMRFDSSGLVSAGMFDESWRRFVFKMATGSGKTKVMSLAVAWSFFHRLYEPDSALSRNFLVIAPNIIVLDRILADFEGLRIFFRDPVLPDNGYEGRDWRDDFQVTLHKQDEVRVTHPTGNIFLTNIHRVYTGDEIPPSADDEDSTDYFLGAKPTGGTTDSTVDLGMIVREIDELMVVNDEAHHIHDAKLAWFKSIEDIHNRLVQKGSGLALQVDVTATPKHNNGAIFVQTVADYPLVEAIQQNVVKHPVLPDAASRTKLGERQSSKYTEKYADYLELGVIEWRKAYTEHAKMGKKAILFVMTDDTRNCDDVAVYLEGRHPDLKDAVLVIHTKSNGEVSEAASGKAKEELDKLRAQANGIDGNESPYKAIVSVLMLKEGWDVRNVTTIVGLRAYGAKSKVLPEQTLGRGLRKMYPGHVPEFVSVVGTNDFMEFVERIQAEGVELERKPMGAGSDPKTPLIVEVDTENEKKDLDKLDIELPVLGPRVYREFKNLADLAPERFEFQRVIVQDFTDDQLREIVFKDITTGDISHTTVLDSAGVADYRSALGFFTQAIMRELRLFSGYDVLYPKVKAFVQRELFGRTVELDSPSILRNLSETVATKTVIETFKKAINELTVRDKGDAEIRDTIKLRNTRPFITKEQGYLVPKRSVFNRIVGDSGLELEFAAFLDSATDVESFAKNYLAIKFKLDYVTADGGIGNYYPDFLVKMKDGRVVIVEVKGQEDVEVEPKMMRLGQWIEDVNRVQSATRYDFVFVDQEGWEKYRPKTFGDLLTSFTRFKDGGGDADAN